MADKPKHQGPDWERVNDADSRAMGAMLNMMSESGNVRIDNRLASFLYQLMRDHVTPGVVEGIILDDLQYTDEITYTNGWLARYAEHLAKRLTAPAEEPAAR